MNHIPSKSVAEIIRTNTLTFFNALCLLLGAAVFMTGEYRNMLFLGVIVANTSIGIVQELKAKRVIDRLSLLSQTKARVLRGGEVTEVRREEIIVGDILVLDEGRQISADCEVLSGEVEVNESLLTGESCPVVKKPGDVLLSGSFVVCGEARAAVRKIGADSFAFSIMKGAKYLKKPVSEIYRATDRLVRSLAVIIIPIGLILAVKSVFFTDEGLNGAVNSSVAAMIAMLPQGLILLTSIVMAVSVLRLSRHNCLCRDMYCAEALARADVLCLDKTGTITTGEMTLSELVPLGNADPDEIKTALCALMRVLPDKNPTATAIRAFVADTVYGVPAWEPVSITPFSSARRFSGASFAEQGSYTLSAASESRESKRTLTLFKESTAVATLVFSDEIRPEARRTLEFFARQGVEIKIISGDDPAVVKAAASAVGVKQAEKYIDMSRISSNFVDNDENESIAVENLVEIVESYTIFGRVTPHMKLNLIKALKQRHTVGMVGDGVNDVLPLKEADFSAAMQSGSEAARNVASLVLLDNNFASLPKAVAEGRRSINNLERSAALFLTKTVYSLLLAVVYLFIAAPFPFIPIQMSLINGLFIGLPSLVLALEGNKRLIRGGYIKNVLSKAVPYGLSASFGLIALAVSATLLDFTYDQTRTSATIILGLASFAILCNLCRPLNRSRLLLITVTGILFSLAVEFFEDLLSVTQFTPQMHVVTFILCTSMIPLTILLPKLFERFIRHDT
jgi:cation-transporting ATPase E